ncbi:hypothetical protein BDD12DRAFT_982913 [Trichophaea hybrida]|nr:hypothetical protein BDD12DRAFT_982913 [Trichophaea hybrida]
MDLFYSLASSGAVRYMSMFSSHAGSKNPKDHFVSMTYTRHLPSQRLPITSPSHRHDDTANTSHNKTISINILPPTRAQYPPTHPVPAVVSYPCGVAVVPAVDEYWVAGKYRNNATTLDPRLSLAGGGGGGGYVLAAAAMEEEEEEEEEMGEVGGGCVSTGLGIMARVVVAAISLSSISPAVRLATPSLPLQSSSLLESGHDAVGKISSTGELSAGGEVVATDRMLVVIMSSVIVGGV